tara:strand:- start:4733 stop:6703 length:1971 start_codon:yes stop_codon:yes gene_type:complete
MRLRQLTEDGRIVKGVNTTVDVGPNEIPKQAKKWGFKVDKDGRPPTLSKKVKGKSTNVLYNLGLAESAKSIQFRKPNFDAEWGEAERYPEFKKIGKDNWIDLAKQGKPVTVDNAMSNKINNTEAGEKDRDQFDKLDPSKRDRFVKDLVNNNIELPIIARYSDGYLELVGGNTRLTGMMSQIGQGKAWVFDVPDEVANLAESKQNLNEAIQFWPLIAAAFTALAKKKGVKRAKAIMSEFMKRLPPGAGYAEVVDLMKLVGGMTAGWQTGKAVLGKKDDVEEATVDDIASASEIYVDMDGVLADFFGDWKKLIGKDWRTIKDIGPALQKIRDTEDFWLNLPMTSNAKNLLNLIKDVKGNYKILSSPLPDDPNSEPHKREWIKKNLSFFPPQDVIITFDKAKFAKQQDGTPNILIDDYGVNIQKWEAAGGVGFKHKDHKFERTAKNIKQHMSEDMSKKDIKKAHKKADKMLDSPKAKKSIAKWAKEKGIDPKGAVYAIAMNQQKKESYARDQLPQIKNENLANIKHIKKVISVKDLIPVQEERINYNLQKQVRRLANGKYNPIVVDCDNKIINGHHRYDALLMLGIKEAEVAVLPWTINTIVENFADGKKKGKSRPGRVKRSGASCKGSVTSLRKKAKNASGEKAKMYHWCANMKSGRK